MQMIISYQLVHFTRRVVPHEGLKKEQYRERKRCVLRNMGLGQRQLGEVTVIQSHR